MNDLSQLEALKRDALAEIDQILSQSAEERTAHLAKLARSRPDLHQMVVELLEFETAIDRGFMEPSGNPRPLDRLGPGERLGPYRILRLLGEGGMGEVWLASRDDGLYEGQVAIKTLHPYFAGGALRERFLREAQVLGRLAHSNIAKMLDAGIHDGVVYLVLEYVVGRPIDVACDEERFDVRARLNIFLSLCAAVAHAHAGLVVHRDIKPGNVLLTADGIPKLLDFGIASFYEPDRAGLPTDVTRQTGRTFTPQYASPEQVLGQEITTATDVYALGVLLYVLLTGESPYGAAKREQVPLEQAVLNQEPLPLVRAIDGADRETRAQQRSTPFARLKRDLGGDLENIVQKALKKRPPERYPTVAAFADDVRRHLHGEPVQARADSTWYRAGKFVRRNRLAVGASVAVVVAMGVGFALSLWQLQVARAERRHAEEVKDFVAGIFRSADPFFTGKADMSAAELLTLAHQRIEREFTTKRLTAVELLNIVGESQVGIDQYDAAAATLNKSLSIAERMTPRDEMQIAVARTWLSDIAVVQGDMEAARKLLEQALPVLRNHRPRNSRMYAAALQSRAELHNAEGEVDSAIGLSREAVTVLEAAYGRLNSETIMSRRNLAVYLTLVRRYEEAKPLLDQSLQDAAALATPGERLAIMQLLESGYARLLLDSGDLPEGIKRLDNALDLGVRAWGPKSDAVAVARSQLALAQARQGDLDAAIATARAAYHTTEAGVIAARGLTNLGRYNLLARRVSESLEVLREAVELEKRHDSGKGSWLPSAQAEYGTALALSGRFAEARTVLDANLPMARESGIPIFLPSALNALGLLHRLNSQWAQSEQFHREALALTTGKELIQKPRAEAMLGLGIARLELGQPVEAETLFRQADEAASITYVQLIPLRADIHLHLGRALQAQGKSAEARAAFTKVHDYWQNFDAKSRGAGEAAYWLAQSAGGGKEARTLLRRAVELLAKSPLPRDARLVQQAQRLLATASY